MWAQAEAQRERICARDPWKARRPVNDHQHDTCTHCGSRELLEVAATPSQHSHIVVMVRGGGLVMRTVRACKYVCTDCGRMEEWVNSKDDLKRLKTELVSADKKETQANAEEMN
jgi:hypothetical protein